MKRVTRGDFFEAYGEAVGFGRDEVQEAPGSLAYVLAVEVIGEGDSCVRSCDLKGAQSRIDYLLRDLEFIRDWLESA